jgi:hypothetical protein
MSVLKSVWKFFLKKFFCEKPEDTPSTGGTFNTIHVAPVINVGGKSNDKEGMDFPSHGSDHEHEKEIDKERRDGSSERRSTLTSKGQGSAPPFPFQADVKRFAKKGEDAKCLDQTEKALSSIIKALFASIFHPGSDSYSVCETDGRMEIGININLSADRTYESILAIATCISTTFYYLSGVKTRCGILAFHPEKKDTLIPLAVYVPGKYYCSENEYHLDKCFSGDLLRMYAKGENGANWKNNLSLVYSNLRDLPDTSAMQMYPGQSNYIQSIAGSVLYHQASLSATRRTVSGVVNIDSNDPDSITEADYDKMKSIMQPVFAVLAIELSMIHNSPCFFQAVYDAGKVRMPQSFVETGDGL